MKKILSFVLVLAMIASMMCVSVSAAATDITNSSVGSSSDLSDLVGTHHGKNQGDIGDGVSGFAQKEHGADVSASLSATINNKYAVEIYYQVSDITIAGDATWDVNALTYVNSLTYSSAWVTAVNNETDKVPTTPLSGDVKVGVFKLVNYSDLDVNVTLTPSITAQDTGITFTVDNNDTVLDGAYNGSGTAGENQEQTNVYNVSLTSDDWARSFAQLNNKANGADSIKVGQITITVVPANSNHTSDSQ